MKSSLKSLFFWFLLLLSVTTEAATCTGKFANPVTDICWSCVFPIRIGGMNSAGLDQEDTPNPPGVVCACGNPPKAGLQVSFWEPVRRVDVVRSPFCMTSLGGINLNPGFDAPVGSRNRMEGQAQTAAGGTG